MGYLFCALVVVSRCEISQAPAGRAFVCRSEYSFHSVDRASIIHDWNISVEDTGTVSAQFLLDTRSSVLNQFSLRRRSGRATNNRPLELTVSRSATIRTAPMHILDKTGQSLVHNAWTL